MEFSPAINHVSPTFSGLVFEVSMAPGLYLIYCETSNKGYIGQSSNLLRRLSQHYSDLSSATKKHPSTEMQNDFDNYGLGAFHFFVICWGPDWADTATRLIEEQRLINEAAKDFLYNENLNVGTSNPLLLAFQKSLTKEEETRVLENQQYIKSLRNGFLPVFKPFRIYHNGTIFYSVRQFSKVFEIPEKVCEQALMSGIPIDLIIDRLSLKSQGQLGELKKLYGPKPQTREDKMQPVTYQNFVFPSELFLADFMQINPTLFYRKRKQNYAISRIIEEFSPLGKQKIKVERYISALEKYYKTLEKQEQNIRRIQTQQNPQKRKQQNFVIVSHQKKRVYDSAETVCNVEKIFKNKLFAILRNQHNKTFVYAKTDQAISFIEQSKYTFTTSDFFQPIVVEKRLFFSLEEAANILQVPPGVIQAYLGQPGAQKVYFWTGDPVLALKAKIKNITV